MGLLDAVGIAPGNNPPPAGPFERSAQYHMQAGQRRQAQRDMSAYVPIGIQRLQEIGTPQAAQAAQLLQQNPKLFFEMAKSYGGAGKWEQIMRAEAQQGQAGRLAGQAAQDAGVPADLAALYELDPATGASVHKQLYPQQQQARPQYKQVFDPKTGRWTYADVTQGGDFVAPGPSGTRMTIGENGEIEFASGPGVGEMGSGQPLTRSTISKQQDAVVSMDDALYRLQQIENTIDSSAFLYQTQFGDWMARKGVNLGLVDLSPEEKKGMSDRAVFRRTVFDNINRTIKDITGAAMTQAEAERIIPTQPNLDMTEDEFRAVLENARSSLEDGRDRRMYLLNRGALADDANITNGAPLSIEAFRAKRNRRGDQIAASLKEDNPGISERELDIKVISQLESELASGVPW